MNASVSSINGQMTLTPEEVILIQAYRDGQAAKAAQKPTEAAPASKQAEQPTEAHKPYEMPEYLKIQIAYPLALQLLKYVIEPPDIMTQKYELTEMVDYMIDIMPEVLDGCDHHALQQYLDHTS